MGKSNESEKRDSVRATFCANIRFSLLDAEEYEAQKKAGSLFKDSAKACTGAGLSYKEDDRPTGKGVDPGLIDFLIQIEDKLDRVLDLLASKETDEPAVFVGQGLDISGGGMSVFCEQEVRSGQILDVSFRIFRYPAVTLRAFGSVERVQGTEIDGRSGYLVALEFLDLGGTEKEWIISYVFQVQRETIRNKRIQ